MEVLGCIFRELLEEECQESVDIFACSDRVRNGRAGIRVSNIDWLVEENHAGIGVPRIWVVHKLNLLVDTRRAKFEE